MSDPLESRTPLLTVGEYAAYTQSDVSSTTKWSNEDLADLRVRILNASAAWSQLCGRRFDEFVATQDYTPLLVSRGGDLLSSVELRLNDDLKTLTTVINGDGGTVTVGDVLALPGNRPWKTSLRLNPSGGVYWHYTGSGDWYHTIHLTGVWGMSPLTWPATGATLAADLNAVAGTFRYTGPLEVGMVVKLGSEQLLITALLSGTATAERAFNGTTAATHASGAALTRFTALPLVARNVARLARWMGEQDKSPLFGQAVIGDLSIPVDVQGLPRDVMQWVNTSGLKRIVMPEAV